MGSDSNRTDVMLIEKQIKVGDLVRLSYYGRTLKSNPVYMRKEKGKKLLGIITVIDFNKRYPVFVKWIEPIDETVHSLRELKSQRGKK